jgi:protease-4
MIGLMFIFAIGGAVSLMQDQKVSLNSDALLSLKLEGIIINPDKFLKDLKKYSKDDKIKGVLVQINSPGGVVGPSQEIYEELKRVRKELGKPVVVSCSAMAASGAYYAAVAADKIITNPGTLMGSIGVIMEFVNLQGVYDWAKVKRFTINTGPYKDSGSDYRPMREDERKLFQDMLTEVHMQFKTAVAKGRKLPLSRVVPYSDGRIFTGEMAVKIGFADQIGTFEDARRVAGELAGLGDDPELFVPPKDRPGLQEFLAEMKSLDLFKSVKSTLLSNQLYGQPLFILPGSLN